MTEIIEGKGGEPALKPDGLEIGSQKLDIRPENSGTVLWIDNQVLIQIAGSAGASKDSKADVVNHKKKRQRMKKVETMITIFSEPTSKLGNAEKILNESIPLRAESRWEMIVHKVTEIPEPKKAFILER